jgi:Family of unknown function (DUF6675)
MRTLVLLTPLALCIALGSANGSDGPRPPCERASSLPAFAPPEQRPNYEVLKGADWVAPTCTGWISRNGVVVAVAAQFHYGGTKDDLLARFGAISTLRNVRYWSVTENDWRTLITHAAALRGPDLSEPRADFTATELKTGKDLYFTETDNRLGEPVIYRLRARAKGESLVITTENVSAVQKFMLPLASPGDLQSIHYLTQIAPGTWSYYALARTAAPPLGVFGVVRNESYVNRALALYSHFTNTAVEPLRSSN